MFYFMFHYIFDLSFTPNRKKNMYLDKKPVCTKINVEIILYSLFTTKILISLPFYRNMNAKILNICNKF